jgi:hypothetical protein
MASAAEDGAAHASKDWSGQPGPSRKKPSGRGLDFELSKSRPLGSSDLLPGDEENGRKSDDGERENEQSPPVARFDANERPCERQNCQKTPNHDDRIHAGALPVAAAQMEPHPEFVAGQGEPDAVYESGPPQGRSVWPGKEKIPRGRGQQGNPVVQVMDMRPTDVQVQQRESAGHDQEDDGTRTDERHDKCKENAPRDSWRLQFGSRTRPGHGKRLNHRLPRRARQSRGSLPGYP